MAVSELGCRACEKHAMLVIAGHVGVDPDRRDEYVAAFAHPVRRARQAAGCLCRTLAREVGRVPRWPSARTSDDAPQRPAAVRRCRLPSDE